MTADSVRAGAMLPASSYRLLEVTAAEAKARQKAAAAAVGGASPAMAAIPRVSAGPAPPAVLGVYIDQHSAPGKASPTAVGVASKGGPPTPPRASALSTEPVPTVKALYTTTVPPASMTGRQDGRFTISLV